MNITERETTTNVTNGTVTDGDQPIVITTEVMYILIGALGGAVIILALILLLLYRKRKQRVTKLGSTTTTVTESSGPQTNLSFEVDPEDDPIYRPSPENSTPSYMNVNETLEATTRTAQGPSNLKPPVTLDLKVPIPRQQSEDPDASDYENAGGIVYENCNDRTPPKTPPRLTPEDPPLPPRKPSPERKENMFRKGTKAYNMYSNALQDYELSPRCLEKHKQIGKGNFSTVYSGVASKLPYTHEKNKKVAIKVMKNSASDSDKQEFLYEFEIMKLTNSLNHDNITRLLGSVTKSQPCMIVLELMPHGNLRNFLRSTRSQDVYYNLHGNSSSLSERQLLQFALDIANGMEGIADLQLLHRDLAARNILLDANLRCKISDFGFAKDILNKPEYKSKSVLRRARPVRWLAPESVLLFKHSIMSDVWSYGIVLWEIVTLGNLPYPDMKVKEVQQALTKLYRMSCPTHCSPDLYRVMACCWEQNPQQRPPFHQLVDKMRQLLDQATRMIDIGRIEDDDYIDVLPTDEQELFIDYSTDNSTC